MVELTNCQSDVNELKGDMLRDQASGPSPQRGCDVSMSLSTRPLQLVQTSPQQHNIFLQSLPRLLRYGYYPCFQLAQACTVTKRQSQDSKPGSLTLELTFLTTPSISFPLPIACTVPPPRVICPTPEILRHLFYSSRSFVA